MRIIWRKIYFWSICIFFLLALPLLLLYLAGYRYDAVRNQLITIGAIYIETLPNQADIYLDEKLITSEANPKTINNLKPGEYFLEIKKTGYQTWAKKIEVLPKQQTFVNKVILFKASAPQQISALPAFSEAVSVPITFPQSDIIGYTWDQTQKKLVYFSLHELWLYDADNSEHPITLITRQTAEITAAVLHPDLGYIIYTDADGIKAIELDNRDFRQTYLLTALQGQNLQITNNGKILYFKVENANYQLTLF